VGTKAQPSSYDCYTNLEDDEPYFLLMGRDPHASALVRQWATKRQQAINIGTKPPDDREQVMEALSCADAMDAYRAKRAERNVQK
jgi:hypothetical protein